MPINTILTNVILDINQVPVSQASLHDSCDLSSIVRMYRLYQAYAAGLIRCPPLSAIEHKPAEQNEAVSEVA